MGSTASTAHRLEKRRALYLHYFDDKMGAERKLLMIKWVQTISGVFVPNFSNFLTTP